MEVFWSIYLCFWANPQARFSPDVGRSTHKHTQASICKVDSAFQLTAPKTVFISLVVSYPQPGESLSAFESKITLLSFFPIIAVACFLPSQTARACCTAAVFVYSVYFPYLLIQGLPASSHSPARKQRLLEHSKSPRTLSKCFMHLY